MSDYVLQVNFREDQEPLRIVLHDHDAGAAETAHQALETQIEHAQSMNAPVVFSAATSADPTAGVPIDAAHVTGVDLVEPA